MKKLGRIKDAKILKSIRDRKTKRTVGLRGLIIEFLCDDTIVDDMLVQIEVNDKIRYYTIKEIEIVGSQLLGRATETGFYATYLSNDTEFDIRHLLGVSVYLIEDESVIKKVKKEACYM